MKKVLTTIMAVLACGSVYSLPLGNPAEASIYRNGACFGCNDPCGGFCSSFSFRVGFYGDYVFNRNLQIDGSGINGNGDSIEDTEIFTNAGYLALNFCDRVDVFATMGVSNFEITTSEISWVFNGNQVGTFLSDTSFSWSVGGRASLYEWGCFTLGVEGQYFRFNPELTHYVHATGNVQFSDNNEFQYSEWQVGLGLAYELFTCDPKFSMIPYAGIKWSGCKLDTDDFRFTPRTVEFLIPNLENDKTWGWALGLTFNMCDLIGVTAEGRWADEKAFHIRGQVRF